MPNAALAESKVPKFGTTYQMISQSVSIRLIWGMSKRRLTYVRRTIVRATSDNGLLWLYITREATKLRVYTKKWRSITGHIHGVWYWLNSWISWTLCSN